MEIPDWQVFQVFYGLVVGLITGAVVITIFIIQLEGKVKTLERLVDDQKNELSDLTKQFRDIGIQYILSGMKGEQSQK